MMMAEAAAAASSTEDDGILAEAMMKLTLSPLNSDESDTDLDVSAEELEARRCSFKSERRKRTAVAPSSQRETTPRLSRSQTVYLETRRESRLTEQGRVVDGLSLDTLCLRNRYLGSSSFRPVSLALRVNSNVTKLDFECNGLDAEGMLCLANVLKVNTTVKELILASNCIGDKGAIAVADMMKSNSTIHTLDLSSNRIGEEGGKYIALGIEENESVRRLNLSNNRFSETGALYIGRALAENFILEELDISWCRARKVGAVGLCQGVRRNVSLAQVSLAWNCFGYEGALALAELIRGNKYVRELDVSHCRINWQCATMVAEGLRANSYLETLRIGGNPLSTTGCMDILESLTGLDCSVSLLDLRGNKVATDFEMLAQTISAGREFTCLHDGVLPSHDLIGQRCEQRRDPMAQVVQYMERFQLRPLELLRTFDKSVMLQMGKGEFTARLQKAGIHLKEDEVEEIIYQLKKGGEGRSKEEKLKGDINYKKFSDGFRDQRRKERLMKIQERNLQQKLQSYHNDILTEGAPKQRVSEELGRVSLADVFHDRATDTAAPTAHRQSAPPGLLKPLVEVSGQASTPAKSHPNKKHRQKKRTGGAKKSHKKSSKS